LNLILAENSGRGRIVSYPISLTPAFRPVNTRINLLKRLEFRFGSITGLKPGVNHSLERHCKAGAVAEH
jgi:hypothetical protein